MTLEIELPKEVTLRSPHLALAILLPTLAAACGRPEPIPGNAGALGQGEVVGGQVWDSLGLLALREEMVRRQDPRSEGSGTRLCSGRCGELP